MARYVAPIAFNLIVTEGVNDSFALSDFWIEVVRPKFNSV